jgi:hypothetical protein
MKPEIEAHRSPAKSRVEVIALIIVEKLCEVTVLPTELMFRNSSKIPAGGSGAS